MKCIKRYYTVAQQLKVCCPKAASESRVPIIKRHLRHLINANNMVKEQFSVAEAKRPPSPTIQGIILTSLINLSTQV